MKKTDKQGEIERFKRTVRFLVAMVRESKVVVSTRAFLKDWWKNRKAQFKHARNRFVIGPKYSSVWDDRLNDLLNDGFQFTQIGDHWASIGPYKIWRANHPYASFSYQGMLPSREIARRAQRRLEYSIHMAELFESIHNKHLTDPNDEFDDDGSEEA